MAGPSESGEKLDVRKSPKEQLEDLMNVVVPFAVRMLKEHGELHPVGATMAPDGTVALDAAWDGPEHPLSQT